MRLKRWPEWIALAFIAAYEFIVGNIENIRMTFTLWRLKLWVRKQRYTNVSIEWIVDMPWFIQLSDCDNVGSMLEHGEVLRIWVGGFRAYQFSSVKVER